MFSVHNTLEEFKNATITGLWICVWKISSTEIARLSWGHRFEKAPFIKCCPSTLTRKAGIFKFPCLRSVFKKLRFVVFQVPIREWNICSVYFRVRIYEWDILFPSWSEQISDHFVTYSYVVPNLRCLVLIRQTIGRTPKMRADLGKYKHKCSSFFSDLKEIVLAKCS